MLYILLGLVFSVIIFLLRLFCDEVIDFLDFLFVSGGGGGGGIFPFIQASQHTWNTMVPYVSPLVVMSVDTMLSVHQTLSAEIGSHQLEELFLDFTANTHVLAEMVFNMFAAIVESDPEDLVGLSLISKELTMRVIESHSLLIDSFDLSTGDGWAALLPLIQSGNQLAMSAALAGGGGAAFMTSRTLLSLNTSSPSPAVSPYQTLGTSYIQSLQKGYQDLNAVCDVEEVVDVAKSTADRARAIRRTTQGRGPPIVDKEVAKSPERKQRLEKVSSVLREELSRSLRQYQKAMGSNNGDGSRTKGDGLGKKLLGAMGFETLDGMVSHVREEYGDGRGFLYSLAPHKHFANYTRPYRKKHPSPYKSDIHFSEYLEQLGISGKEYARATGGSAQQQEARPGQRKLQQIIPGPIDILDCFSDVPPDPLCILGFIFPLPLDPPPFLEPVLDFDCDCPDYEEDCLGVEALQNSLLVLQTIISLFSSIEALGIQDFFMMITLPDFIVDNLFLEDPGEMPDTDDIICAILHLDCFLIVVVVIGFILLLIFGVLKVIADIWNCCQHLRLLAEHEKMFRMVCVSMRNAQDVDTLLRANLKESLFNPGVRNYNDPDYYQGEGYWSEDVRGSYADRPIIYENPHDDWRVRKYPGDTGAYERKKWTPFPNALPIGGEMGEESSTSSDPHHVLTSKLQKHMVREAMRRVDPDASSYRVKRAYHTLYPEESIYRYHTVESLAEELMGELGYPLAESEISDEDRKEVDRAQTMPYLAPENTEGFVEHLHRIIEPPHEERRLMGLAPGTVMEHASVHRLLRTTTRHM